MIYTVTLNPALDYFVAAPSIQVGSLNRATSDQKEPGGKGINVSTVLTSLQASNVALGFIGGFTGEFIQSSLKQRGVRTDFIRIKEDTRLNVKVKSEVETEINGVSPTITISELNQLTDQLTQLTKQDIVVLSGSVPSALEPEIYQKWIATLRKREVNVFLDTSGLPLTYAIQEKPTFIKPNHHELSELVGQEIHSIEDAIAPAKRLVEQGIQYVMVTFAGDGALLVSENVTLLATAPTGQLINSIGAGDSTVAGFIYGYQKNWSLHDCFQFAIASGSATAFSANLAQKQDIESLLEKTYIRQV
ncbi:1-phosphofructokinase [Bacillus sp. TS-2]|nr:1-phosphofructokinase [Bacillus sp. TS-2]